MNIAHGVTLLPASPYEMWIRDELADWLRLPEGIRVEVIGGDFVASPTPAFPHNVIVSDLASAFAAVLHLDPAFPWRHVQVQHVDMAAIGDGYIPDLVIMDDHRSLELVDADARLIHPEDIALVVEVTSKSNATNDRAPGIPPEHRASDSRKTKWSGYARCGIPFYLLIDRDPRLSGSTVYFDPNPGTGVYGSSKHWPLGEPIVLPEPFGIEIPTTRWKTWS